MKYIYLALALGYTSAISGPYPREEFQRRTDELKWANDNRL